MLAKPNLINKSYISEFDGLRAIAILIVFVSHLGYDQYFPGGFGVTLFFFISGFLITRLLLIEFQEYNTLLIKNFYLRRVIRLYPTLMLMILMLLGYVFISGAKINLSEIPAALFYYENYYCILNPGVQVFKILWSLAIEEHFYLGFPIFCMIFFRYKKALLPAILLLSLVFLLIRIYISHIYNCSHFAETYNYMLTHTRADSILYGCFLSVIIDKYPNIINQLKKEVYFIIGIAILLFTLLFRDEFFRQTFRYSLQGIAFLFIIPYCIYTDKNTAVRKILANKVMVFIGKLSYSLYLMHWVGIQIANNYFTRNGHSWQLTIIAVTVPLTLFAYYAIEKNIAIVRKRLGSNVKV